MKTIFFIFMSLLLSIFAARTAHAQVVGVTAQLDTNTIVAGQATTLRIYAQVLPAYRASADQIFSWYVDVLNTNAAVATANFAALLKPVSDKDPLVSSNGFTSGADRLAIYDTFLNLPRAGVTNPVELLRIPVTAVAAGQTRFRVRAGTAVPVLSQDFIVAPLDGGEMMTGGDYSSAGVNLTVLPASGPAAVSCLTLSQTNLGGGFRRVTLAFCPLPGYDHYIDFRDQVQGGTGWQPAAGGPYNSGTYVETNSLVARFYRVRAVPAGTVVLTPFRVDIVTVAPNQVRLTYPITAGFNYTVESGSSLTTGSWTPLPGGPHNSGNVFVTNPASQLFFRVGATPQ